MADPQIPLNFIPQRQPEEVALAVIPSSSASNGFDPRMPAKRTRQRRAGKRKGKGRRAAARRRRGGVGRRVTRAFRTASQAVRRRTGRFWRRTRRAVSIGARTRGGKGRAMVWLKRIGVLLVGLVAALAVDIAVSRWVSKSLPVRLGILGGATVVAWVLGAALRSDLLVAFGIGWAVAAVVVVGIERSGATPAAPTPAPAGA